MEAKFTTKKLLDTLDLLQRYIYCFTCHGKF
jgi:hypothetical protein